MVWYHGLCAAKVAWHFHQGLPGTAPVRVAGTHPVWAVWVEETASVLGGLVNAGGEQISAYVEEVRS